MRLDIFVHFVNQPSEEPGWVGDVLDRLDNIETMLAQVLNRESVIAMNVADLQAKADTTLQKVQADTDVANSVKTVVLHQNDVLAALQQQIKDLQSQNDPAALQKLSDTIDSILATETSNAQTVADAVTAGTPVEPAS
jgi:hypothetical protein